MSLHIGGKTAAEIAIMYGCSTHPVKVALRRLGLRRAAKPRPGSNAGDRNPAWKGGRRQRSDGYIEVWTPEGARLEHQVVMEAMLGRPLAPGEVVHHIDGNRANNGKDNLQLTTQSAHILMHLADMHAARYGK